MSLPTTGPRISPADETIRLGPLTIRFLTTGNDTNASLVLFELTVPAAERLGAPPHSHDHYEETIYGIEGVLTWIVDGTPIEVRPGQALPIRRGAVHRFENNGDVDARALCLITPARIGPEFFRESADVINAAIDGKPDRMQLVSIMLRYGLKPVLPPQALE